MSGARKWVWRLVVITAGQRQFPFIPIFSKHPGTGNLTLLQVTIAWAPPPVSILPRLRPRKLRYFRPYHDRLGGNSQRLPEQEIVNENPRLPSSATL